MYKLLNILIISTTLLACQSQAPIEELGQASQALGAEQCFCAFYDEYDPTYDSFQDSCDEQFPDQDVVAAQCNILIPPECRPAYNHWAPLVDDWLCCDLSNYR